MRFYNILIIALLLYPFLVQSQSTDHSDCVSSIALCSKQLVHATQLTGAGNLHDETLGQTCFSEKPFTETNSIWYQWKISESGNLNFTILPDNASDDFDFVLFRFNDPTLSTKTAVRCMQAGPLLGEENLEGINCTGATGLKAMSTTEHLSVGCSPESNNFLSSMDVQKGEVYALFVNNFRATSGFALGFDGSAQFDANFGQCSGISDLSPDDVPSQFQITDVYPNPATQQIVVGIDCDKSTDARLQIIALNGTLAIEQSNMLGVGENKVSLNISQLLTGAYFLKISTPENTVTTRFYKE